MKSKKTILLLSVFLTSVVLTSGDEVWVSPVGTDGTGNGTAANPYVRSSQTSFDALMQGSTIPANSTIHLMPGTFLTEGNIPLQAGWKFRGAGIDVTTIKIVNLQTIYGTNLPSWYTVRVVGTPPLVYRRDGVEVSDMTVDCNLQNQGGAVAIGAVYLQGADTKISRVKAVNWGSENNNECTIFGIAIHSYYPAETNCLIEDCIVEQPAQVTHTQGADGFEIYGGPTNQFGIGGNGWICGAEIRNCRIYNVGIDSSGNGKPIYFNGMGIGYGVFGAKMDGNIFINVGGQAVGESCGSLVNCSIENNMLLDVFVGIAFQGSDYCWDTNSLKENIRITDNFITVQNGGSGMIISGFFAQAITNLTVENNMVQATGGTGTVNYGLQVSYINNLRVQNNILDANGGCGLSINTNNVTISQIDNNQNLAGVNITTPAWIVTNSAAYFFGNGSGLTGITASQVGAAAATNATIWNSISVTNTAATNWAALSVTQSNAVISVRGRNVAILQTNGVLNAVNGLSTTVSNTLPASRVNFTASGGPQTAVGISWTNTTSWNIATYVQVTSVSPVHLYYNGSIVFSNIATSVTVMLKPGAILSVTNASRGGTLYGSLYWHPF
jgi:hypothetical protein